MKSPLLMAAFLLLILSSLYSQAEWRQLTTDNGLSSNKILSIYQAKNGDIWIGTDKGLNRYNGIFDESSLFRSVYNFLESPTGQIVAREIEIASDLGFGNVISGSVGINLFDGLEWNQPDFFDDDAILVSDMPQFAVESDGKLWMSATRHGLVGFDGTKWQLHDPAVSVDWLVKTLDGRLWSQNGAKDIISFNGQRWSVEFNMGNSLLGHANINIKTVLVTSTDKIILGTNQGLFQYDPLRNVITDLKLGQVNVRVIYENSDRFLWVGSDQELFRLDNGKWQQAMDAQTINTIKQTKQGILWVGTSNGLYRLQNSEWVPEMDVAVNCFTELTNGTLLVGGNDGLRVKSPADKTIAMQTQLAGKLTTGLFLASDGTLWCRSMAGIFSYDGLKWTNHRLKATDLRFTAVEGSTGMWQFSQIYEDKSGTIWFNNSLNRGGHALSYKEGTLKSHLMGGGWTWDFVEPENGDIWALGQVGPYIYDGKDWSFLPGFNRSDSYTLNYAAYQDADGSIWVIGDSKSGVWLYDNGKWLEGLDSESKRLEGGRVAPLRTPDGTLWISTAKGIYYLNAERKWEKSIDLSGATWVVGAGGGGYATQLHLTVDSTLIAVNVKEGLLIYDGKQWSKHPSYGPGTWYKNIFGHGFVEYPQGVFWLATNRGLRRIQGDFWYDLTVSDGLPSNDVYTVELDNSGNLWVGTTQGLTRFTPPSHPNPPAIQLTAIDGADIPDERIYRTGRAFVSIDWRGGDIETDSSRLQYQYNLHGRWSEITRLKTATIGLENGEHQFAVRAIDHHFNVSPLESLTIIVKTEAPYLSIRNPGDGDIVNGEFYIRGRVKDDDFKAFQVFLSDSALTEVPVFEKSAEANPQNPYRLIYQADALPRTAALAILDTKELDDGDYQIWLAAQDQRQHSSFDKITFRVDNTAPKVKIMTPQAGERVLKRINISAIASDIHLDSYRLEFSTDPEGRSWEQIYLQAGWYQKSEDALLPKPELKAVEINRDWEIPIPEGQVWIRLTATDIAGNSSSQTIQVEVPTTVVTRKGSTISLQDQQAELYFPPNTLAQDTIVAVNALTETEVELPVRRIS